MPINVSDALDLDTGEIVTIERFQAGGYADGIYTEGSTNTFKTLASVQQPNSRELMVLPEGERAKNPVKILSKKPVRTADVVGSTNADVLIYQGNRYRIMAALNWQAYGYTGAMAVIEKGDN